MSSIAQKRTRNAPGKDARTNYPSCSLLLFYIADVDSGVSVSTESKKINEGKGGRKNFARQIPRPRRFRGHIAHHCSAMDKRGLCLGLSRIISHGQSINDAQLVMGWHTVVTRGALKPRVWIVKGSYGGERAEGFLWHLSQDHLFSRDHSDCPTTFPSLTISQSLPFHSTHRKSAFIQYVITWGI